MQVLAPVYGLTDAAASAQQLERAGIDGVFADYPDIARASLA